jgi:hypothetical protein
MSLSKEKDQDLRECVALPKMRAFLCFQMFQATVEKSSKKKGFPKSLLVVAII